jgi:hypothetical protein
MQAVRTILLLILLLASTSLLHAKQIEVVAGAGPSTEVVKLFFRHFPKQKNIKDYKFIVPEKSAKHQGGIINADNFLFGRTGRPIKQFEYNIGKREIPLAQMPISFVAGKGVPRIPFTMNDIRKIFLRDIDNWLEFGGTDTRIELIGRERFETVFRVLKKQYPFFKEVVFDRVFHRDDEVIEFIAKPAGKFSIAFGVSPNFSKADRVMVSNFNLGITVGLVYDVVNDKHPIVLAAKEFANSIDWKRLVIDAGMIPVD